MFTSLHIQGNLISEELLQQVAEGAAPGQQATDFGLEPGTRLSNEIEYAWSRIRLEWKRFADKREALPATDPYGTTLARRWMEDFFKALGFDLDRPGQALEGGNSQRYSISHTSESPKGLPVHIVGFVHPDTTAGKEINTLDVRSSGGTSRLSPHSTVQEYLNVTNHLYGLVTNGLQLRLLRDSGRLVKFTYIEFDLRRMLEQDQYADFTLLYRLLHCSRFGTTDDADNCWLEEYYKQSIETGNRIRDGLSKAVKEALTALGNGFVSHPDNEALRLALSNGTLPAKDYYRELLRLVYRLLFLLVTEERDLVYDPEDKSDKTARYRQLYRQYYSLARLRRLSEHRYLYNENYTDLWPALQATFRLFEADGNGQKMGIQPLGSDLFSAAAMPHIVDCTLANRLLLECLRNMNEFTDPVSRSLVTINYRALDVEELGSVYEGLLDLHPVVQPAAHAGDWSFTFHEGTDRKTTGSYYTRPDLVNELIKSALIPVIEERLKANAGNREAQTKALLALKVCDPAAGSGHMLLAAARTIAWYLARVESGDENPGPSIYRSCLRQVIQHCIYAVDYNPDAVELCKLALWLESHNSGKPLSFLDHKIRNGNSLVGVTDLQVLTQPLPDEAFNPVTGDDPAVCRELKKANAVYRRTRQASLFAAAGQQVERDRQGLQAGYAELEGTAQDSLEAIDRMARRLEQARQSVHHEEVACHIWTAAFFKTYTAADDPTNPGSEKLAQYFGAPTQFGRLAGEATRLALQQKFFHWPLEFPDVWEQGGFDVMLGNPPWEMIQLNPQEFFLGKESKIVNEENQSKRNKLIEQLKFENIGLYNIYLGEKHSINSVQKFIHESGRYPLSSVGRLNTAPVFTELFYNSIHSQGRLGLIVPTGIATDSFNQKFFSKIVESKRLVSLFDFENSKGLFRDVHRMYKFCLLTLSGPEIQINKAKFGFFLKDITDLVNPIQTFELTVEDFIKLNPNTKTCPVFRTEVDAKLTTKIYTNASILLDEGKNDNPWNVSFKLMFMMNTASNLFRETNDFTNDEYKKIGNKILHDNEYYLPLYEAKMIWQYDHRYGTFHNVQNRANTSIPALTINEYADPVLFAEPWYWVKDSEIKKQLIKTDKDGKIIWEWDKEWFVGFRDVTNASNERTSIFTIQPYGAFANNNPLLFTDKGASLCLCLVANANSLAFDYPTRFKIAGMHMNFFYVLQLPFLKPERYQKRESLSIISRALELTYTCWDIKPFADDLWNETDEDLKATLQDQWQKNKDATGGHPWAPPEWCADSGLNPEETAGCPLPPFKWDEERRAVLKAELDALYAKLYGLTTEELCYILDPQDVYGPDFPGETFRVLKEKEQRLYGEYRTRRLVLEAWERLQKE